MSTIVGIDLGTSNSVVAWEDEVGRVRVLADRNGLKLQPSVVGFVESSVVGGVVVGSDAKVRKQIDPANTIYSFKRLMGQGESSLAVRQARSRLPYKIEAGDDGMPLIATIAGKFSPVELLGIMLDHLRELAAASIGRPVTHAVVTVPANFNEAQRSATASAGAIAGLEVARVLNEPTAAAIAYGSTKRLDEIIAVYDFGGGTFDLTIMKLEDQVYTVLGTAGDSFLGGDDIDERLVDRMLAKVAAEHRVDLREDVLAMMKLRGVAEQLKIELSQSPQAHVDIPDFALDAKQRPIRLDFTVTRGDLEKLIVDLVDRTISVTRDALSIAQLKIDRVSDVLLVGGSTRIPFIRNRVAGFFSKAVRTDVSPEDAVAIGAAVQAASLEQLLVRSGGVSVPLSIAEPTAPEREVETGFQLEREKRAASAMPVVELDDSDLLVEDEELSWPLEDDAVVVDVDVGDLEKPAHVFPARPVVIDVTPSSFGVATVAGYCELLIQRNSRLPISVTRRYVTARDSQDSVRIVVCQGETRHLAENTVLGSVVLYELPKAVRGGVEIEVAFALDTSGMLRVSALDTATGQSQRVALDLVGRMDETEVAAAREKLRQLRR